MFVFSAFSVGDSSGRFVVEKDKKISCEQFSVEIQMSESE
jgi:hypothetical protein